MGDVRKAVAALGERAWRVPDDLPDDAPVPRYSTGADLAAAIPAAQAPPLDLAAVVADRVANPFLLQRRVNLGLVQPVRPVTFPSGFSVEDAKQRPTWVDWRGRWGGNWLTAIQNQNPCESCWAFAAAALVETMVRIEHGVWSKRSEGDLRDGWGLADQNWPKRDGPDATPCRHGAGEGDALDFIKRKGIADPDCYPWYATDHNYTPTADREGRTVKIDAVQQLGTVEDQKQWLDAVGPITASFTAYDDFKAYGRNSGIYRKSLYEELFSKGEGHDVLVIGYNDDAGCWVIRNSWGESWGDYGYGLIAYGEVGIDDYVKYGIHNTNPDPWTKRRLHNGCVLESGNGPSHRNFEMIRPAEPAPNHVWRAGGENGDFAWRKGGRLPHGLGAGTATGYPALIQSTFARNFECVAWELPGHLRHWWFDQAAKRWNDGGRFGPADAAGYPGFIQSNYGAPGNFEVVVRTKDGRLNHWWRDAAAAPMRWHDGGRFGAGVRQSGPSLVQSQLGAKGNLDLVCVLDSGGMQHWWRDNDGGNVWHGGTIFGSGVGDTPVAMIESEFGATTERTPGNFELCVAVNGKVQHWWRNNSLPERDRPLAVERPLRSAPPDWTHGATFGHDVKHVWGLLEGSFGFNLEVIVERTDGLPQHYWRDGAGWHEGEVINP